MRALTLWQPWAAAIALGWKPLENRTWVTPHRGTLAIAAAKRMIESADVEACLNMRMKSLPGMRTPEYRAERDRQFAELSKAMLAHGCVVAVVNLAKVLRGPELDEAQRIWWAGTPSLGFIVDGIRRLQNPVACVGRQKLFELPEAVEKLVRAQLCRNPFHLHTCAHGCEDPRVGGMNEP